MEVILKKDVDNLGFALELVNVKPGYGRNFLIPQKLAELATPNAKVILEKVLEEKAVEEKSIIDAANKIVEELSNIELSITAKSGEKNKIFGSINNNDLAEAFSAKGVKLEKKNIRILGNTIKTLGVHTAKIKLHRTVEIDFTFDIVAEVTK